MSQLGYGANDPVGSPFQTIQAVAAQAITALGNKVILNNAASVAGVAITLPLNPPDGCQFQLMSTGGTTASTVAANTGDTLLGTAVTAFTANTIFEWCYSLNGSVIGNAAAVNARSWFRTR